MSKNLEKNRMLYDVIKIAFTVMVNIFVDIHN